MRSYAQAIGVMAQVRMAHANILATKERLDIDIRIHTIYENFLEAAEANKRITGTLSQLELDHMRLNATEKEIERILSLGNYYVAYYRILNTLGINDLREKTVADLQVELDAAKAKAMKELEKAEKEFKEQNVLISDPLPDQLPAEETEAASTETEAEAA